MVTIETWLPRFCKVTFTPERRSFDLRDSKLESPLKNVHVNIQRNSTSEGESEVSQLFLSFSRNCPSIL